MDSSAKRLARLGAATAERQVYGIDVDPAASGFLQSTFGTQGPSSANIRIGDFLEVPQSEFGRLFEAIVGNPPYVRHHFMSGAQLLGGRGVADMVDGGISGTASYWAYFLVHALSFLRPKGRLALILPSAFLAADYARPLRQRILASFARVRIVLIKTPVFGDAEERCVVLLADGFGDRCARPEFVVADSGSDLHRHCAVDADVVTSIRLDGDSWREDLLPKQAVELLDSLSLRPEVRELGTVAAVRIGTVTGANDVFVLPESVASELRLPAGACVPCVSTARQLRALAITEKHYASVSRLLCCDTASDPAVRRYLASPVALSVRSRLKCRIRDPWFAISDVASPDAFLVSVVHYGPRLVVNEAGYACTNAIHRVWFAPSIGRWKRRFLALSSLTSLAGLTAEIYGRTSGGGALKLEPRDAAKILLVLPNAMPAGFARTFREASSAVARGNWALARSVADSAVLGGLLRLTTGTTALMKACHDQLRAMRLDTAGAKQASR